MIKITITQPDNTSVVIEIPFTSGTTPPVIQVTTIEEPIIAPIIEPIIAPIIEPIIAPIVSAEPVVIAPVIELPMNYSNTHAHTKCVQFKTPISVLALETVTPVLEFALSDIGPYEKRTKANVVSTINQLNKYFGWPPKLLHYSKIESNAGAVKQYVIDNYIITNTAGLRTKLLSIVGAMSRCVPDVITKLSVVANTVEKTTNITVEPDNRVFPNWVTEVLPALDVIIASNNKICSTIATIFKEGYVFRIAVLFNTMVGPNLGQPGVNYLDLGKKIWSLGKIKGSKPVDLLVTDALVASIGQFCTNGAWLIDVPAKDRVNPTLGAYDWSSYTNNELRHSFETFNVNTIGRSIDTQNLFHTILGHSRETALQSYVPIPK